MEILVVRLNFSRFRDADLNRLKYSIMDHFRKNEGKRFVIGVSGGVDSVVLLHLIKLTIDEYKPDLDLVVAHFDHKIRNTSENDAKLCERLCTEYELPFILGSEDVPELAKKFKWSIEEAARYARHEFFRKVGGLNYSLILAHHSNDRVETILFNLFRGTGITGMSSLPAYSRFYGKRNHYPNGGIFRPLIQIKKESIYQYADKTGLIWIEDETNADTKHTRNWIRNVIIPQLEVRYTTLIENITRSADNMSDVVDYMETQTLTWLTENTNDKGFSVEDFRNLHVAMRRHIVVYIWKNQFKGFGPTSAFVEEILKWADQCKNGSNHKFGEEYTLVNRNGRISIKKAKSPV